MRTRGTKSFSRLVLICSLGTVSFITAFGQNPTPKSPDKSGPVSQVTAARAQESSANETFELNIGERRFTKTNFEASTAVDTGDNARGVNVRIGVSLNAGTIDVLLRNVQGSVRFRGTLDRILEIIGRRSGPQAH